MGYLSNLLMCSIILWSCCCSASKVEPFDDNYVIEWGAQQITFPDAERTEVQIQINQYSGGGFRSKDAFGSGYFQMSLKVPKNTTGVITTFYLTSLKENESAKNHDELDFEFVGQNGPNHVLQTNVFAQDDGHREQRVNLWFDPTSNFHDYTILWNQKHIVFYVDRIPVRVMRNKTQNGAHYPNLPMFVHGSLWNDTNWLGPTDWSQGPFYASYRGFGVKYACRDGKGDCGSLNYAWNNWQELSAKQEAMYEYIKKTRLAYDYCNNAVPSGNNSFPECLVN